MRNITFTISLLLILIGSVGILHGQTFPIEKGTDVNLSPTSGYLRLGTTNSINLIFDQNEIQARNNGSGSSLFINDNGGNVTLGSPNDLIFMPGFTRMGANGPSVKTRLITLTAGTNTQSQDLSGFGIDGTKIINAYMMSSEASVLWITRSTESFSFLINEIRFSRLVPGQNYRIYITYIQ